MSSRRIYSKLTLAYVGTKINVSPPQLRDNLTNDPFFVPPIIDHPTCVDSVGGTINFSVTNYQQSGFVYIVSVNLSQAIDQPLNFNGRIQIQPLSRQIPFGQTITLFFSGTISAGSTNATATSTPTTTSLVPVLRKGITSFNPVSALNKTIVCTTPY